MTTPDPTGEIGGELRLQRRDRRLRRALTAVVIALTAAGFVGSVVRSHSQHPDKPINWLVVTGFVALIVGFDTLVMWFVFRYVMPTMIVPGGDSETMRRVSKQLRRGESVDEKDRPTARALVELTTRQRWLPLFGVVVGVLLAVSAVLEITHTPPRPLALRAMAVVVALVIWGGNVYLFFIRRRVLANGARQGLSRSR